MRGVFGQVDPATTETIKHIVSGADGRTDTTYLAMICLLVLGIVLLGVVLGGGKWLMGHLTFLTTSFREEMRAERESHEKIVATRDRIHQETSERLGTALDKLTDAIDGRIARRRRNDTPMESA